MKIMKKTMYAAFVFAALSLTACKGESNDAEGGEEKKETVQEEEKEMSTTYNVVAEDSKIGWKGTWIAPTGEDGAMEEQKNHTGTVQITEGSVTKKGEKTMGNFVIDMTTINNTDLTEADGKPKLEGHLASEDFFNVEEYAKVNVALNSIKNGMAEITIDVMGMKMDETVAVETVKEGDKMMINGSFSIDFSALEFQMFSPNPEKPEEGHIDTSLDFNLKATLKK
jgi:polyisoprenoid-binding protein YceI